MSNNELSYTVYQQAIVFWYAYERCMMRINQNGQIILPVPAMANSAFSVELFLKAILEENSIPFEKRKGHCLDYLFRSLPNAIKESIVQTANYPEFDKNLSQCSKVFEDFRYLHEDIFKSKDVDLKFWENFINAVYTVSQSTIANKGSPVSIEL